MCQFLSLVAHVLMEEVMVVGVLVELLGCEHTGEHGNVRVQLHAHEAIDDRLGDELVPVDAAIDDEADGCHGVESSALCEQTTVQREFERAGDLEKLDMGQLVGDHVHEAGVALIDDVAMPARLHQRQPGTTMGRDCFGHARHATTSSIVEVKQMSLHEYLTIGEAARRLGIKTSALRFYEDQGLITSERTGGNQRRYARDVLRRVSFIRAAQEVGLHLREIRDSLQTLPPDRAPTQEEWAAFAEAWRPRLDHQIRTLEGIRDRLASCIGCGCQTLDSCHIFNPDDIAAEEGPGARYLTLE